MGCSVSTEAEGRGELHARRVSDRPVEVTWETDSQWEALRNHSRQVITDGGQQGKEVARASQKPIAFFAAVRSWVDNRYRDCARTGAIRNLEMDFHGFPSSEGTCHWPTTKTVTQESSKSGVFLACTYAVAIPLVDGETWPSQGAMLETPEMEAAKAHMVTMVQNMENSGLNMDHTEIHIFMGVDMVRGKWRPSTKEPTIKRIESEVSKHWQKSNKAMAKTSRRGFHGPMAVFLSSTFDATIKGMLAITPGGTVWDEGELPFSVSGEVYPHATRVLVVRDEHSVDQGVEATHYKVITDPQLGDGAPLLRNAEPSKDPGGVVRVLLMCALQPYASWPQPGAFAKTPEMKAADAALIELLKKWNREGKVQRCIGEVVMGADNARFSFVGEAFQASVPFESKGPAPRKIEGDIEGFFIRLVEEPKHELFESEGQFQVIKAIMREKMAHDPERTKALVQQVATAAAHHVLDRNYPGADVSVGEFPVTVEGKASTIPDTVLLVARDPKKQTKNIIAIVYTVPSPDGESPVSLPGAEDKNWLGTREMKDAVAALLDLMKQWYTEGKISEEDCMAQVVMGMDADTYQFVDGERFVDYSEERMKQFSWG